MYLFIYLSIHLFIYIQHFIFIYLYMSFFQYKYNNYPTFARRGSTLHQTQVESHLETRSDLLFKLDKGHTILSGAA